jgi:hypothetical protein
MHVARRNTARYLEENALCVSFGRFKMFGIFIALSFKKGCLSAA